VIVERNSGASRSVFTNETGAYRADSLPLGTYQVTASRPLFKRAAADVIGLQAGQTFILNLVLHLAEMTEVVIDPGQRPLLSSEEGYTYYVDSAEGDDEQDGLSQETAWKSLSNLNSVVFGPGDSILFKAGSRFTGQIHPQGSGAEGNPIVIDVYGEGNKPLIEAAGHFDQALLLENQEYWEINNLELTNTGQTRKPFRHGVRLRVWDYGTMRHIHLKNLLVRDVNGSLNDGEREGCGIRLEIGGDRVKSHFDGLLVENCHLLRTDRNGICGYASYSSKESGVFPNRNIVIRENRLEDISGDEIRLWDGSDALIEHNVVSGTQP
jgi:hypothetical protein